MSFPIANSLQGFRQSADRFLNRTIWQTAALHDKTLKGRLYSLLRILSIVIGGLSNNRLLSRSAALSYYSLIALAPLLAIVVMISGFILHGNDTNLAVSSLTRIIRYIAPPVDHLTNLETLGDAPTATDGNTDAARPAEGEGTPPLNEELVELVNHIIDSARSGAVGLIGALLLIVIGIQLLTSIESTFNEIWGVRRGRSWILRVVIYWTLISLGAILGFASVTLLSAATLVQISGFLPFSDLFPRLISFVGPLISFLLVMALLYGFYKFIPNTRVKWRPALAGAFFVTLLLILNNYISFIYVNRVITQQSLYGSLGIFPVLMIGIYIFWFFVLIGGQITYSVQNADTLTHREAWNDASVHTREALSLAAFTLICRRFKNCDLPYSAHELSELIRAPGHILNESLNSLSDLGLINSISGN